MSERGRFVAALQKGLQPVSHKWMLLAELAAVTSGGIAESGHEEMITPPHEKEVLVLLLKNPRISELLFLYLDINSSKSINA